MTEPRFTFGLWTVGNPGRDPFGEPTRAPLDPVDSVHKLAELGAWGVSLHDNDLVPWGTLGRRGATGSSRASGRARGDRAAASGWRTTNLFGHPAFKDGAFTSNDRGVRRAAIGKAMRSIDLCASSWAPRSTSSGAAARAPRSAAPRTRATRSSATARRSTSSSEYVVEQGYDLRVRDRAQAQRAARRHLPADRRPRAALHHHARPAGAVGVNPEVAHETMAGLSFLHGVGQALWAGKLFHIDLNGQRIGRYDQDFRFGAEDLKEAFHLVRLLERAGYDGPRHFDAHAYRSEDADGVWDFAAGCMRTYRALAERAAHFDSLPAGAGGDGRRVGRRSSGARRRAASARPTRSRPRPTGLDALAVRGYSNERLDQLVVEVLLGLH